MKIKIKKLRDGAVIPTQGHNTDAGYDLYSLKSLAIPPHCVVRIETGIAVDIPPGYAGFIHDRSSMGIKGYHRHAGVVDCGYHGDVSVCLCNTSDEIKYITAGDRIAQLVIQKVEQIEFEEVTEFTETERGIGGWGSTGV